MLKRVTQWWGGIEASDMRARLTDVNDGIIAVAGMGLGLAGAEVNPTTTYAVVVLSALVGAVSVFGIQLGEAFAEREAVQFIAAQERRLLELSPEEELTELVEWFELKGVSPPTARAVAEELSAADALSAQLEIEYGIRGFITSRHAWAEGLLAGLAFLIGALGPVIMTLAVPWAAHEEWIVIFAGASLIVTSLILSRRGLSNIWLTVVRSLIVGLTVLGFSYALGDWLI